MCGDCIAVQVWYQCLEVLWSYIYGYLGYEVFVI